MHLLQTTASSLDDSVEPLDLGQTPGDIVVLSFADSDLAGLAAAYAAERDGLPSVRLAHLRDLRHPMSIDLWIDKVARHAKVIVVRLLGGLDWWRYGVEALSAVARERNIALAVLPGEDRDDPRLEAASTLPPDELAALLAFFREGGRENLQALLRRLAGHAGFALDMPKPQPVPRCAGYLPGKGAVSLDALAAALAPGQPVVPIIFYRSALLAADTAPIDALCEALAARGLAPAPLVIPSLKDPEASSFVRGALTRLDPAVIVTTTAFAAGGEGEASRARWRRRAGAASGDRHDAARGLAGEPARAWACRSRHACGAARARRAHSRRAPSPSRMRCRATTRSPSPPSPAGPSRTASLSWLIALPHWRGSQRTPRAERRIAVLMPDYPGAAGRTGLRRRPRRAGQHRRSARRPRRGWLSSDWRSAKLAGAARGGGGGHAEPGLSLHDYRRLLAGLPAEVAARVEAAWGEPEADPDVSDGAFRFRAAQFGNLLVALPPDRGRVADRRAAYHDPTLPPRHAAARLRSMAASRRQGRCHRAYGRARHARMAARQGRGADRLMLPGGGRRPAARVLSVPRQQSGRSGAGQASHRRRDHRPSAAAAGEHRARRPGAGARAAGR